ncbi:MAG: dephospho-CoA kinase [Prevotella sp.]|nr:dephospho-CoA kinase [Prevotella sp.]
MTKIAITGGIGSGKSYVCELLRKRGVDVYDCDAAAKRLMRNDEGLKERLRQLIGNEVYVDGRLNKAVMAEFLLQSDSNRKAINAIVHPAVRRDFIASGSEWMECAILFESGFDTLVDYTICVTAPEQVRIVRIMHRDNLTEEKARQWIARQLPQEEVARRCDAIIINDGVTDLEAQLDKILKES